MFAGGRLGALVGLALLLGSCSQGFKAQAPEPVSSQVAFRAPDLRDDVIYFALTDRFANGDTGNDNGPDRGAGDRKDPSNPLAWHGGDWAGITQKIKEGYFQKLGATAIWISPVVLQVPAIPVGSGPNTGQQFAGYHGYWAEDFFKTDPHFGSLQDLKNLVNIAHANKLKIIQDVVMNHTGYGASLTKAHPDWFHTDADCQASANKDQDCPLAGLPDLKQDKPEVTQFLNDFITYWTQQTRIDGLRIDTMKHVTDAYWRQFFAPNGAGDPRKLWSVGEVFNGDPAFVAKYIDQLGSPSAFDFPLYFNIKDQLSSAGGNLDRLADLFAQDGAYKNPWKLTTFVDNHDVPRFVSEVQNRGGSAGEATERLDLALSLIFTSRGTPSVYYGTEIAMAGKGDPYDYPLGQSNREDMDFSKVPGSPLAARLAALSQARTQFRALQRGAQQELWRPNGGAPIFAYRRVTPNNAVGNDLANPVVVVMNNGSAPVELGSLAGGGIPLLGTFGAGALTEVTGRANNLRVEGGKLVGTVPARGLLAVTAPAGTGAGTVINPNLPEVGNLIARAGDGAAQISWSAPSSPDVTGYRLYRSQAGGSETLLNFAPLPKDQLKYLVRGLTNGTAYTFRVVTVDAQGRESSGVKVSATPSASNTAPISFTVDARTQGNGPIELRRFDTGSQLVYPMTQVSRGVWKTDLNLPLFREIKFKFGNTGAGAKNSGYEGPDQPDRSAVVGDVAAYSGTYDFITTPVPDATIEGRVSGKGSPLGGALVEAAGNPKLNYALSFADGTYFLRAPSGAQNLTASASGFVTASRGATAPATGVDLDLTTDSSAKYSIDGDLSDWGSTPVNLLSADAGTFGADNNWLSLKADSDAKYLYLGYTYRVSGNRATVYLDVKDGGATSAAGFDVRKQAATFGAGVDFFLSRTDGEAVQLRRVDSDTATTEVAAGGYLSASRGTLPEQSVELAIPWSALGLSGKPSRPINLYAGIFGGDGYGAGDIVPNATSTPSGANEIQDCYNTCKAVYTQGAQLP